MAKKNDISATEKLLDLIRHEQRGPLKEMEIGGAPHSDEERRQVKTFRLDETADSDQAAADMPRPAPRPAPPQPAPVQSAPVQSAPVQPAPVPVDNGLPIADIPLELELEVETTGDNDTSPQGGLSPQDLFLIDGEDEDEGHSPVAEATPEIADVGPLPSGQDGGREPEQDRQPRPAPSDASLVRESQLVSPAAGTVLQHGSPASAGKASFLRALAGPLSQPRRKGIVLGIDILQEGVAVVKLNGGGTTATLLDYRYLEAGGRNREDDTGDGPWFAAPLAGAIREMAGGRPSTAFCCFGTDQIDTMHSTMPVLPEKERTNGIYWTVRKEKNFEETATILDFSTVADYSIKNSQKTVFTAYLADRASIDSLRRFLGRQGVQLQGVTSRAQALRNMIPARLIGSGRGLTASVFIDEQRTQIDIFHYRKILFSREINTGLSSMNEGAMERLLQNLQDREARRWEEQLFSAESIDPDAVNRLLRQLQRTIDYCVSTYETSPVERVLISGLPANYPAFINHCATELGVDCEAVDLLRNGMVDNPALPAVPNDLETLRLLRTVAACGVAVDGGSAQNFLFTYREKAAKRRSIKFNLAAVACAAVLLGGLIAYYTVLAHQVQNLASRLDPLKERISREMQQLGESNFQTLVINKVQKIQQLRNANQDAAKRYYQSALIGELLALLPAEVRLAELAVAGTPRPTGDGGSETSWEATVKGVLFADGDKQEVELAGLLKKLSLSPLINTQPAVRSREVVKVEGRDGLYFTLGVTPETPLFPRLKQEPAQP
ncbi:MAG: hypothetical protein AB1568_11275 [Thermodesulfobacteriota bacterium]